MPQRKHLQLPAVLLLILLVSISFAKSPQQVEAITVGDSPPASTLNQPLDSTSPQITSLKMVVVLAEFPDAKHKISADEIKRRLSPTLNDYYQEVSYGKVNVAIDVTPDWILLSQTFSSYGKMLGWLGGAVTKRMEMVNDILQAAGNKVNFSPYDGVIIIIPNVSITRFSWVRPISAHGSVVNWVTVQTEVTGVDTFAHEFGHSPFGMPDLYDYNRADMGEYSGIYVGPWCLMSAHTSLVHFCAYNKIVAGWIPPERIKKLSPGSSEFVILQPSEIKTGGIQVIKIPVDNKMYYLIEARRKIGFDKSLPDEGVLITFVDETKVEKPEKVIQGPAGFVKIKDADTSTEILSDATFDMRPGKKSTFTDEKNNLAVIVIPTQDKAYDIYVTTPSVCKQISGPLDLINQAKSKIDEAKNAKLESPEAISLIKEAESKLTSVTKYIKDNNHTAIEQDANSSIKSIEKAFSAEPRYTEVKGVSVRAENAIKKAEAEKRTSGLDEAKNLLQQSQSALDTHVYDKALIGAIKAKKTAEAAKAAGIFTCNGASSSKSLTPFEVISLNITPSDIIAGKEATVTAKVANISNSQGSYTATLAINEAEAEKKPLTIPPEGTEVVTFKVTKQDSGTYTVKLGELSQTFVVKKLATKEMELKYDDGTARDYLTPGTKLGYLVDFTPPATPFKIKIVRIMGALYRSGWEGKEFEVAIVDKDKKVLHKATYPVTKFEFQKPKWVDLEVPNIEITDKFYVYLFTGTGAGQGGIYIGADDSVANMHSDVVSGNAEAFSVTEWQFSGESWFGDKSKVNWMIRVVGTAAVPE